MKASFLFFCLFFALISNAQNEVAFLISLEKENNVETESDFYVDKIYDGRQVKDNVGTVQKTILNTKTAANFKKPFIEELQNFLSISYPKRDNRKPISIRIDELYVSEITESNKETGYATVILDIIERKDNKDFIIGTYSSTIEGTGFDVTGKHDERLIKAILNCFDNYKKSKESDRINIEFNPEQIIENKMSNTIEKGVYLNYIDVFNKKYLNIENYIITDYQGKNCLLNRRTGKIETNFYGFSDGNNFYINLFRFSVLKFYLKAEIMGDYYFVNEVQYTTIDASAMRALYGGLLGIILFPDPSEMTVPLLIDRLNGKPLFLTNKYMADLLSSDKELLKEYKRTGRTVSDKKRMYKKYFNLN